MTITAETVRPHQLQMLAEARHAVAHGQYLLVSGGRGVFKTSTLVVALASILEVLTRAYRGYTLLVVGMTYDQLRGVFLDVWEDSVPQSMLSWSYHRGDRMVKLPNQGRIWLRAAGNAADSLSAENAARILRGRSVHGIYAPEASSLSALFWNSTEAAIRKRPVPIRPDWTPPHRIVWLDTNPAEESHWLRQRFMDPKSPQYVGSSRVRVLEYRTTVETSAYDQGQLDSWRRSWPEHEVARMLDARWVGASGPVYSLHVGAQITDVDLPPGGRCYLSFDFGYRQDPYVALLIYECGGLAHVIDEVSALDLFRDGPNGGMLALVRDMLGRRGVNHVDGITGDLAGVDGGGLREQAWWAEQLHSQVRFTQKARYTGWLRVLKGFTMPGDASGRPILTVHPRCTDTIKSLRALTYHPKGNDTNPVKGDDWADALRYYAMSAVSPIDA